MRKKDSKKLIDRLKAYKEILGTYPSIIVHLFLTMKADMEKAREDAEMWMTGSHTLGYISPHNTKAPLLNIIYDQEGYFSKTDLLDLLQHLPENVEDIKVAVMKGEPMRVVIKGDPELGTWFLAPRVEEEDLDNKIMDIEESEKKED